MDVYKNKFAAPRAAVAGFTPWYKVINPTDALTAANVRA